MNNTSTGCRQVLTQQGLTPLCEPVVCEGYMQGAVMDMCRHLPYCAPYQCLTCLNQKTQEQRYFPPATAFKQCDALNQQDPDWTLALCYCGCGSPTADMLIGTPAGETSARDLGKGDAVLVASCGSGGQLTWHPQTIVFSSGIDSEEEQDVVRITIAFGEAQRQLVVAPDHVFLLDNGKLTIAGKLTLQHRLVDGDGAPVPITMLSSAQHRHPMHQIATRADFDGSVERNLILRGGVVTGDYTLQLHYLKLPDSIREA